MSRCFPFPPPGYEKKPRPDDANLLIKEKNREKKHKKEKKEKKERKEKKDKERSEEKHREKREKRHKHNDQKDKEKDKEKKRTSEEKKVLGTSEHQNGEKPSPTGIQGTDSQPILLLELEKRFRNNDEATESKMVGKIVMADQGSVRFQGKVTRSNFGFLSDEKEKFQEKRDGQRMVNGQTLKVVARGLENEDVSNVMGEDQKKVEGGVFQVEKVNEKRKERKEKKKHKSRDGKGDKHQNGDQNKQNKSKDRKGEKQKEKEEKAIEERSKEQIKRSSIDTVEIHGNGPSYLLNESSRSIGNVGKRKEPEKEKKKEEKVIEERSKEQIKRSSTDKVVIHVKEPSYLLNESSRKEREKEKVEEKAIEEKSKEQIKQSSIDTVDIHGNGSSNLLKESSRSKGILGKRKDPETNGVLYDDESQYNELSRSVSSSHQVMQNGSKYDPSQTAVKFALERQVIMQNHKVNAKVSFPQSDLGNGRKLDPGHIVNGFMSEQKIMVNNHKVQNSLLLSQPVGGSGRKLESHQAAMNSTNLGPRVVSNHKLNNVSSSQPDVQNQTRSNGSQAIIHTTAERQGTFGPLKVDDKKHMINGLIKTEKLKKTKEKFETHKRPPHPDSKYLSDILTVPEVAWSDFDDQEWLLSSSDSKAKKPRTVSTQIEETKLVWAEALPMEAADVVALPYVIPY